MTADSDQGIAAIAQALGTLSARDRQEFYLIAAVVLESKLPRGKWKASRVLRSIAREDPVPELEESNPRE